MIEVTYENSFAKKIAKQIFNDATSGSGAWDELNGPSASLQSHSPVKYTVVIPQEYDENDQPTSKVCTITVEVGDATADSAPGPDNIVTRPVMRGGIWKEEPLRMADISTKPGDCRCPEVKVGGQPTGSRNWSDSCPEHGVGTEYFKSLKPFGYETGSETTRADWLEYLHQPYRENEEEQ